MEERKYAGGSAGEKTPTDRKKQILQKLVAAREELILIAPFYGRLLMNLKFVLAPCRTAATDMTRMLWDPEFAMRLNRDEMEFIMKHEVLHCVLQHPVRGRGKKPFLYNVAADIVVNDLIMDEMGVSEYSVDGDEVMHTAPNGMPGRKYTADQIYEMLLAMLEGEEEEDETDLTKLGIPGEPNAVDNHDFWKQIIQASLVSDEWEEYGRQAAASRNISGTLREFLENMNYHSRVDWRKELHDFVEQVQDHFDYTFQPADRRYADTEFILPAFNEVMMDRVSNLWFLIDSSGSVTQSEMTEAFQEIRCCVDSFGSLSGSLSFFDQKVSAPVEFEQVEDLDQITPVGGGGTSFYCIFDYLQEEMKDKLPNAIIILTDGYASWPDEKAALGLPVLWVLTTDLAAPWGKNIYIGPSSLPG